MKKKRVIKPDGRYLIFYAFDRALPEVYPDQGREEAGPGKGAGAAQGGSDASAKQATAGGAGQGSAGAPAGPER